MSRRNGVEVSGHSSCCWSLHFSFYFGYLVEKPTKSVEIQWIAKTFEGISYCRKRKNSRLPNFCAIEKLFNFKCLN